VAKKKEEVLDIDESSPFEWTLLESKDYSNDPQIMSVSYKVHFEAYYILGICRRIAPPTLF
jgi:hypothetical protein